MGEAGEQMIRAGLLLFLFDCTPSKYEVIGFPGNGVACCRIERWQSSYTLHCLPNVTLLAATNFVRLGKDCEPLSGGESQ